MIKKIIKFGLVGGIATIIDFAVFFALTRYIGMNPLVVAPIAFSIALIFNYVASMKFVFVAKPELTFMRQTVIFLSTAVIGLLCNQVVIYVCITWLGIVDLIAKLIAIAIVMIISFVSRYLLLEK